MYGFGRPKLIPTYVPSSKAFCDVAATVVVLGVVERLDLYITVKMVQGAKQEVRIEKSGIGEAGRLILGQ